MHRTEPPRVGAGLRRLSTQRAQAEPPLKEAAQGAHGAAQGAHGNSGSTRQLREHIGSSAHSAMTDDEET